MFKRINAFGEEVGRPTDKPTSRIGQNNQRQIGVLYGHNGGGKVYTYLAGAGIRTGDYITPEVTHPKSGTKYKTLARVVSTNDAEGKAAQEVTGFLSKEYGIKPKTIGPTDQTDLKGYKERKAQDSSFTTAKWEEEGNKRYQQKLMKRLNMYGNEGGSNEK